MAIENEYVPKYVDLDDVPIAGPDVAYTVGDKRKAVFEAETSLELDVNDGQTIDEGTLASAHRLAVLNLATHVLGEGAADPSSPTLGDMSTGNSTRDYADQYLEKYKIYVDKILASDETGNSESGHSWAETN